MALWWCAKIFCRLAAAWFPLLFSSLLWQTICPVYAVPSCPRTCSCPGVKEVHCTFRHLTNIPKTFPKDTERLNLGYNSLTESVRWVTTTTVLMLHGMRVVHPGAFGWVKWILKLSYNKLTSVTPGLFEGLVGLIRLHLDHNHIDFIEPYSFSGLTSLKLLQLEGNLLKEIHPHTFITVSLLGNFWTSGLKHLHLSDNLLEQLPAAALKTAPRLELLSLHGNPWTCDCQLHWLIEWSSTHEGVIKCKKERGSSETCPQCSSPQPLNGTLLLGLTPDKLTCERPALRSPLKQWDNPAYAESEAEPDIPYTRDFEKPLGHLTFVLSDSHGNNAHVACDVRHPELPRPLAGLHTIIIIITTPSTLHGQVKSRFLIQGKALGHTLCPPIEPGLSSTPGLQAQLSPTDQKSQLKQSNPHLQLLEQQKTPESHPLIPTCCIIVIKIITWTAEPK
ncbi:matrix-remodeling-associated protein 5-like protein [Lates japonicus]|uniref:Matrix-remodeling-associated protein 5-like protein n=1 Tax=Lates japonicus TaxID=270547 RepID=A0AAD3RAI3_LATJO|nr:matrix-remodeling-associated protein 5-like protein [Lates japonicus]